MKYLRLFLPGIAAGIISSGCGGGDQSATGASSIEGLSVPLASMSRSQENLPARRACPGPTSAAAQCQVVIIKAGVPPNVAGWGPSDLQAAYKLPSATNGSGQIVAIVDAYDNPNVASDLAVYRSYFGLPPANFTKYNQKGQTGNYPQTCPVQGWCVEIDLDVEMVSAACPNCTIYLIEADDGNSLGTAESEAVKLGAHIVSNSWGWDTVPASDFSTPGVVYVASGGDTHYGSYRPAQFGSVVSVGGTMLAKHGSKYREVVWPWTGGGCASGYVKPSWQRDPGCGSRTQNDVAAVAWGVAEYDSYGSQSGWFTVGGTSVAAPLIASAYALAGNAASQPPGGERFWTLTNEQRKQYLHAITVGSDGDCGGSYLCTAGTGQFGTYSGPAGWGTPNGIGAF